MMTSSTDTEFAAAPPSSYRFTTFTTTRAGGPTRIDSILAGFCGAPRTVLAAHTCRSVAADASASDRASP